VIDANPATGPRVRVTPRSVALPLANLAALVLVLVGLTTGGVALGLSAIGVVAWLLVRLALRGPSAPA
jgi:hypothetical protein